MHAGKNISMLELPGIRETASICHEERCKAVLRHQSCKAAEVLAYLHPKRPQAGNSQGYSQLPSPQTGSTQVGVKIWSPMYASTSALLAKVVVIPPAANNPSLVRNINFAGQ